VEFQPNRIGVDTGAYASGRLSAVGLEGVERWVIVAEGTGHSAEG
jgi:serine/threonine protein phosphatase 1